MMLGYATVVIKDRKGRRMLEESIGEGIAGYKRHEPDIKVEDMVALVNPRLFEECKMIDGKYGIDVDVEKDIPYPELWVCRRDDVKKGDVHVRS